MPRTIKKSRRRRRNPGARASVQSGNDNRPGRYRGASDPTGGQSLRLYRNVGTADSIIIPLRYVIPIDTEIAPGVLSSQRYTSNAYDVDAALASTAMTAFAEYGALYSRFRTLEMAYDFTVVNLEAFGIRMFTGFGVGTISSGSLGANYSANPYFKDKIIGSVAGLNTKTLAGRCRIQDLFGTKQALFDDLFSGDTQSNTLSTSYTASLYLGIESPVIPVAGYTYAGHITLLVQFYRRRFITS